MLLTIEETGAQAGRQAAALYKARSLDGTHESVLRILPDKVKAAKAEATKLQDSDSEHERAVAIYWANYTEAFEFWINK